MPATPTPAFPGAIATDANLIVASNSVQTTLTAAMTSGDTSMSLASTTGITVNMLLTIDTEIVLVTSISPITVTRGFPDGTGAAAHVANSVVSGYNDAWHHNASAAEIKAIETTLGVNLSKIFAAQLPGPAWNTFTNNYAAMSVNVNNYPDAHLFGSGTVGIPEGIRGALNIPAGTTATNAGSAIAGYAQTNTSTCGAVGVFGWGLPQVANASVWGANFGASNVPVINGVPVTNLGLQSITGYGIEIDIGLSNLPGAVPPNAAFRGIYIVNGGEATTSNPVFCGIEIAQGPSTTSTLHNAYVSSDAAAVNAMYIGAKTAGINTGSQEIIFHSVDAGSVGRNATVFTDGPGNLILTPGQSAAEIVAVDGGTGITVWAMASGVVAAGPGVMASFGGAATPVASIDTAGAVAIRKAAITLVNGANQNVAIGTASAIRVTGPTGAFSIGGFTGGVDGRLLFVYYSAGGAFPMTISTAAAGSSAANRIKTLTGADVVLRSGSSAATFQYDSAEAVWILMSSN